MSDIASPPVRLPWDVLVLVCREADPATLAVLGRVSFDLLSITAPLLYKHVEVRSTEQLEKLFCEWTKEEMTSTSHIKALLSLSQIKNLSVDLTFSAHGQRESPKLSPSRLAAAVPIPLECLRIAYRYRGDEYLAPFVLFLLPHLNPRVWTLECRRTLDTSPWTRMPSLLSTWTRIEELELTGVLSIVIDSERDRACLGGLPWPRLDHRRIVRLHLETVLDRRRPIPAAILGNLLMLLGSSFGDAMQDGTMLLLVATEDAKRQLEKDIRSDLGFAPWRPVLAVEMEA